MRGKLNLFQAITKRMDWLRQRQTVLAENIANAETPEYVPQDLSERDFRRVLRGQLTRVEPATTNAAHLRGTAPKPGAAGPTPRTTHTRPRYQATRSFSRNS